jgi:hypothetical protein
MILLRVPLRLERTAEQVFLNRQANLNPPPSPCFRTISSQEPDTPASPAQPQMGTEREDAMTGLCWRADMNSSLRRSR